MSDEKLETALDDSGVNELDGAILYTSTEHIELSNDSIDNNDLIDAHLNNLIGINNFHNERQSEILTKSSNFCPRSVIITPEIKVTLIENNSFNESNSFYDTIQISDDSVQCVSPKKCGSAGCDCLHCVHNNNNKNNHYDKSISTTPIKPVKLLLDKFSPHPEKGSCTIDIPRITITNPSPIKTPNKFKIPENFLSKSKIISPVAEYRKGKAIVEGKKIVFKNF